jgi:putative membrane protein
VELMPWHSGPYVDHPWWGFLGWLIPLLFIALLVGLAVFIVTRVGRHEHEHLHPSGGMPFGPIGPTAPPPPKPSFDPALEQVRLRYAKGEIDRDEFLRVSRDLGGPAAPAEAGAPGPSGGSEPPAE